MTQIRQWLMPLSWLYGLVTDVRNTLFDWGVLPSETYDIPIISVGNLTVGGTGKTPHVEYLIRLLSGRYRVAVLSRGYRRKSRGYLLANPDSHGGAHRRRTLADEAEVPRGLCGRGRQPAPRHSPSDERRSDARRRSHPARRCLPAPLRQGRTEHPAGGLPPPHHRR